MLVEVENYEKEIWYGTKKLDVKIFVHAFSYESKYYH